MIHPTEHQKLEDRLSQSCKWNGSQARRIEEATGLVCDSREPQESIGIEYAGDINNNEPY